MRFSIKADMIPEGPNTTIGVYEFSSLPGCSQVLVSHGLFLHERFRGRGLGKWAGKKRINHAEDLGYDYMLCTVDASNIAQIKQLEYNKWLKLDEFSSSRTGHTVLLYGRKTGGV